MSVLLRKKDKPLKTVQKGRYKDMSAISWFIFGFACGAGFIMFVLALCLAASELHDNKPDDMDK